MNHPARTENARPGGCEPAAQTTGQQERGGNGERLALIIEAAQIGTWDWNLGADTVYCSPRCLGLLGLPPGAVLSYGRFLACLHPEDRKPVDLAMRNALERREDLRVEMRTLWPDGSLHWIVARGRGDYGPQGQAVRMVGVVVDLTERKQMEQQLRECRWEAEHDTRVHIAKQAIAAIAHELNQPLSAIASYSAGALRLLESGHPPLEKLAQAFERCAQQACRADQTIRELLAFLHEDATPAEALDINRLVRETLAYAEADKLLDGIKPRLELAKALLPVQANRIHVKKVLLNLLCNSVDALREAGPPARRIWVSVRAGANGRCAQVTVRDSGPGLDAESVRRVFAPLFTTKPRGLGMGLAISRALVEAGGGELWVEAGSGPGASFHFTLPFASELAP